MLPAMAVDEETTGSVTLHPYPGDSPPDPLPGLELDEDAKSLAKECKVSLKPFQRLAGSRGRAHGRRSQAAKYLVKYLAEYPENFHVRPLSYASFTDESAPQKHYMTLNRHNIMIH